MPLHRTLALASLAAMPLGLAAQARTVQQQPSAQVVVAHTPTLIWKAGPPSLPPGAEIAVLEGNPTESGPFTFRLRLPANYRIPPHSHQAIEHITVLSGTLSVAMGELANYTGGTAFKEGSFGAIPPNMVHHAWTGSDGVTIQLHSMGPWTITYVNPADDPRKKPTGSN